MIINNKIYLSVLWWNFGRVSLVPLLPRDTLIKRAAKLLHRMQLDPKSIILGLTTVMKHLIYLHTYIYVYEIYLELTFEPHARVVAFLWRVYLSLSYVQRAKHVCLVRVWIKLFESLEYYVMRFVNYHWITKMILDYLLMNWKECYSP